MDVMERDGRGHGPRDYEPPRIERVLTPAELEDEVLYAGQFDGSIHT